MVYIRNHGRSEWADVHSYESMDNDVTETMDILNLSQFNVIGHSMGGKVAMHLAQTYLSEILKQVV